MRTLDESDVLAVGGAGWEVHLDFGFIDFKVNGPETAQEIYAGAVDYVADFFTWLDPANYYGSACSGGGGW